MKLLIVDDSMIMRTALEKFTSELGLELVGKAGDGKSALAMFKEHNPDVVTLDITMPEMDGLTVLGHMLEINPAARILVVTAITEKSVAIDALKKGAKGFLNKPFTEDKIKTAIKEMLGA